MARCMHRHVKELGETQWGLAQALVEWCIDCGAQRLRMTSWQYRSSRWVLPKRRVLLPADKPVEGNMAVLLKAAVRRAKRMLAQSTIVDALHPRESHCDQCDLQGVCDYLHGAGGAGCKAYPRVYKLKEQP